MSKFTQLQIHTHRVYGMAFPEVDPLISELYREQIGTWICYVDGWVPAGCRLDSSIAWQSSAWWMISATWWACDEAHRCDGPALGERRWIGHH